MKYEIIKMLEYDRIDISEGIDINKCEETSRKCSLCKFYYFLVIHQTRALKIL